MSVSQSNEMFINMKNVPLYDTSLNYYEQKKDAFQFYSNEYDKICNGITLGGIKIHPWLYFHLNYFKTPIPQPTGEELIINPPLRDNEWYFMENYQSAEGKKGLAMFGSRRFSKSVILSSLLLWIALTKENGKSEVIGGSTPDLIELTSLIKLATINMHPAFYLPSNTSNWNKHIKFGLKEKNLTEIPFSQIVIKNADEGSEKSSEKGAGGSPVGFILDEFGKWDCIKYLQGALPALKTVYGMKATPVLAGCLTAGNKVWDNTGNLVNIEDLKQDKGIIGFNRQSGSYSKEPISHMNIPVIKECVKITTNKGTTIECSTDHPILTKQRNSRETVVLNDTKVTRRKVEFEEAINVEVGNQIALVEEVPLFGTLEMENPYLIGCLIGDGTYGKDKGARLANEDFEVWKYLDDNNIEYRVTTSRETKLKRNYQEASIPNISKYLHELGIHGQTGKEKDLPNNIHSFSYSSLVEFIAGLFDTDGCVLDSPKNKNISFSSCSHKLVTSIKLLLIKFGIHSNISYKKPDTRDRRIRSKEGYYVLGIYDNKSIKTFHSKIRFKIKRKQDLLEKVIEFLKDKGDDTDKTHPGCRFEKVARVEKVGKKFVYNLTADATNTYIANGIITHNTGGNTKLSADALKIMSNPEHYNLIPMDWDLLENKIPDKADITWKRTKFGMYIPAQMVYEVGVIKDENNLAKYLNIENKDLEAVKINTTNWKLANKIFQDNLELVKNDRTAYDRLKMYYPLDPEWCFLQATDNPFPVNEARIQQQKLKDEGNIGKDVDIFVKDVNKALGYELSTKERIKFPFTGGGIHDSPVVLFDDPPNIRPNYGENVSGMDPYKQKKSGTDSVGTLYVLQRRVDINTPIELIKASYASRPNSMGIFHRNCEMLIEGFNAECMMENADGAFLQYLELHHKQDALLAEGVDWSKSVNPNSNPNNSYGYYPTEKNKSYILSLVISYCWEKIVVGMNEDGTPIEKLGVEFIPDVDLLQEIIDFKYGGNFDRIVGFGSALAWAKWLDKLNVQPRAAIDPKEKAKQNTHVRMMSKGFVKLKPKNHSNTKY